MPSYQISEHGSPRAFPASFTHVWRFDSPEELGAGLVRLTQCHPHNFAVQMDHSAPAIWGSETAMECLDDDRRQRYDEADEWERTEFLLYDLLKDWFTKHTATRRRDMPNNIAITLRRDLQRRGLVVCRAKASPNE